MAVLTQEQYLTRFREKLETMYSVTNQKNSDYARKDEALANFKRFGALGVLVRISDKYERIFNAMWYQHKFIVDESLADTVIDMAVYSVIMLILLEEEEKDKGFKS